MSVFSSLVFFPYWLISHNIILFRYENNMQTYPKLSGATKSDDPHTFIVLLLSEKTVHGVSAFVLTGMKHSIDLE